MPAPRLDENLKGDSHGKTEYLPKADAAQPVENLRVSGQNRPGRARKTTGAIAPEERPQSAGGVSDQ